MSRDLYFCSGLFFQMHLWYHISYIKQLSINQREYCNFSALYTWVIKQLLEETPRRLLQKGRVLDPQALSQKCLGRVLETSVLGQ